MENCSKLRSVLLFSGGIDSTALLYWKKPEIALLINYGQVTFEAEQKAASEIAYSTNIPLITHSLKLDLVGSGTLAGEELSHHNLYSEFWPFRNQLLLTIALIFAVKNDFGHVMIGLTKSDDLFKDNSDLFIRKMDDLSMFQEYKVKISAPAIEYSVQELVRFSKIPMNLLAWAHSCNTSNLPCGKCPSCQKYIKIFSTLLN